jgi:hypothetical protein
LKLAITLREDHWLRIFERRILRKMFGINGEKMDNEEFNAFYFS